MKVKETLEDFVVEEVLTVTHKKDDCVVFTLEKINWSTMRIVKVLARMLGISQKRVGYAGLKDKRAITRQKMSISGVTVEQLETVKSRMPRIEIYDIEKGDRIRLGSHRGNSFNILVRDAVLTSDTLEKVSQGFSNYFGVQRFGDVRPITHEVGRELIKGNLEKAALIFLAKPHKKERHYAVRKELWETRDFEKAKREFPLSLRYELAMLNQIHRGAREAFKALPRRLNTLFVHAYQAHLFNEIVKTRCEQVPATVVEPGDVVMNWIDGKKVVTIAGEHNLERIAKEGLCAAAPIVGYKTGVKGRMKDITESVLEEEGIRREDFKMKEFPFFSSRGTYREILGKASEFSCEIESEGVRLRFFLPKGQYATVFIEELFGE